MQMLVRFEVFSSITRPEDVQRVRDEVGAQLQKIMKSGKFKGGGCTVGKRGGAMILEVESAEELFELVGPAMLDNGTVAVDPLMGFDKLGEFFAKEKARKTGR
ncbi:MAG TPA: hypothetical protein VL860_14445 [Planctomycetota bacterium]|nr:hypothetical protein [Planctomycetota bacterium]